MPNSYHGSDAEPLGTGSLQTPTLVARVAELEAALKEAIEGWEEGASYKGEYLATKHRDAEGIAKVRAILNRT